MEFTVLNSPRVPDLGVMWDGMAITFAKMGLRDFFLDAKRSAYVFLVQS
jgi:hypothetical protein